MDSAVLMSLYQELCYATLATSNLIVGFLVPTEVGMGVYPRGPKGEVKAVARS